MNDFDIYHSRKNTDSAKWDEVDEFFQEQDLLPLWIADTDFMVPTTIIEALKERLNHPFLGYAKPSDSQFDNLVNFYKEHGSLHFSKDDITISTGVIPIVATSILAFSNEGDEVIFQTPGYSLLQKTVTGNNRKIIDNPLVYDRKTGEYTIDFDHIEKSITPKTKIWLFCNPHNPTSRVWTQEELKEIERIVVKYNLIIISDEIHGYLNFSKYPYTPLASLSQTIREKTIMTTSPSKMFGIAGMIYSFAIIPNRALKKQFDDQFMALGLSFSKKNVFGLVASKAAYSKENYAWIKDQIKYFEKNYEWVKNTLNEKLPKIIITPMQASFLLWINMNKLNLSAELIYEKMIHEAKIAIYEGRVFSKQHAGFYRINIGCPRVILEKAVFAIIETFKDY